MSLHISALEPPYLYCPRCNNDQPLTLFAKTCSRCGSVLLVGYDYVGIAEEIDNLAEENASVGPWKYSKLLPPLTGSRISLGEGGTFLQRSSRLAEMLGVRSLYLKNESTNPTGSFIDRGVALEVSEAIASRIREVQCMPTGNLGASLAAYAARAGIECTIGIAYNINPGKLLQMIAYDAHLRIGEIAPSRDPRCLWVTPVDPYILEGEKTVVFEVWEQLRYMSNFHIIAPMGTGGLVTMLWKGMKELVNIGKAEKDACKLVGVQASGCAPIVDAFKRGTTVMAAKEVETLAIDLKVPHPPLGDLAIEAIRSTKGSAIAVTDGEILEAARLLAKTEGIFAEPVSASTVAALKRMLETKEIDRQDQVICIITGAGLKDPSATLRLLE
ncbi:MAG: pyridoxal-phosphate dependent enzyme, partial [Nitrososphaerota archaeon]